MVGGVIVGIVGVQITAGVLSGSAVDSLKSIFIIFMHGWLLVLVVILRNWDVSNRRFEENCRPLIFLCRRKACTSRMLLPLAVLIGMIPLSLYFTGQASLLGG